MKPAEEGIVQPVIGRRPPKTGPLAIMAATQADVESLRRRMDLPDHRQLLMSRLHYNAADHNTPALIGPVMGAPYAVMLMETLHAWGMKQMLFYGWCGSINRRYRSGDIILPDSAIIDEGTSLHYKQKLGATVHSHRALRTALGEALGDPVRHRIGKVWSTDGIFRETPTLVKRFQSEGAVAVDMELSALLSAALFLSVPLAAVLVVSDELFDLKWRPGFSTLAFKTSRGSVCDQLAQMNGNWPHE